MKALKLFGCLSIFLFLSCSPDSLTYYVDTELKASKTIYHQKGNDAKETIFFLSLEDSKEFETFLPELYDLKTVDLCIKTDKSTLTELKNTTIKIGGTAISLEKGVEIADGVIRIQDETLMAKVASELFENKLAPIALEHSKLYGSKADPKSVTVEVIASIKGTFVGEH